MIPEKPGVGDLKLELGAIGLLILAALVLIVRAQGSVSGTREQLLIERNRRLDAEDLAETREKSIDGVLESLKEANDRADHLTEQLAARGPIRWDGRDPAAAGSAGTSGDAADAGSERDPAG